MEDYIVDPKMLIKQEELCFIQLTSTVSFTLAKSRYVYFCASLSEIMTIQSERKFEKRDQFRNENGLSVGSSDLFYCLVLLFLAGGIMSCLASRGQWWLLSRG